jgi:putative OmpL-like beta-barrel porin-2
LLVLCFAAVACGLAQPVPSSDPPAPAADSSETSAGLKLTAVLDTFYSLNLDRPGSGLNEYRNFDLKQGLELNAAAITLEKDGPLFGFRIDAGFGEMFRIMNLPDPWGGPNRYVSQAYFSYKPMRNGRLRVDFGKFYTSAGAEGPETYNNFNYSRSLLFVLGEPYYHLGARATLQVTKSFSAGVQLLNGWNDVRDNNAGKTLGLTSSLSRSKWTWSQAYLAGPEKPGTDVGLRQLYDSTVNLTPASWLAGYVEALWGVDRRISGGQDRWSGVAATGKFSVARKWSVNPRVERFNDSTGFSTGVPQHLTEATATLDYRPASFLVARTEFRRDWSDRACFERGATPNASKDQNTVLVGLVFMLKMQH